MKKQLRHYMLLFSGILLWTSTLHSTPVAPVRTLEIPPAYPTPAMDGVAESVYSDVQNTTIFNPTGTDGDADFTATFRVSWDPTYLYVYIDVTDDIDHSYEWGVGNPWEFDNIELFLQLDTNTVTTSYSTTTIQLRVCRGLDSVETAGRAPRADYIYYMEGAAAGGWIAEVAVPWTAVMAVGSTPEDMNDYIDSVIGFDFSSADSDNSDGDAGVGNRDVQSAWDDDDPGDAADRTEDLAWNNTSVFGYVTLGWGGSVHNFSGSIQQNLNIYPNPANEKIALLDIQEESSLILYNMQGAVVLSTRYIPGQELDISGLKSGVYSIVLNGTTSGRFVKQ